MQEKLNFAFPLAVLQSDGGLILNATGKYQTQLGERLAPTAVADARALLAQVGAQNARQKSDAGDVGTLTKAQNAQWDTLVALMANAKKTAKKAFPRQEVKLRAEFQVGVNTPTGLGADLDRAGIILASLGKAANAGPLKAQGWLASDTAALAAAIEALDTTDDEQEAGKSRKTGTTGARNQTANQLYDALLAFQNAANLQWPASQPGNTAVRGEFRLGVFPPSSGGGSVKKPDAPKTPPPSA